MIYQELEKQWRGLQRLRTLVGELRSANEVLSSGGRIFYSLDFSELYAYLHFGDDELRSFGVGLWNQDPAKASRQHRLALAHLFHTLTSKLYLLPPYTIEVWAYARTQRTKAKHIEDLQGRALNRIQELDDETKALLGSLEDRPLSEAGERRILDLVKSGDFEQLCVDVGEVVNWSERAHALGTLLERNQLSYTFSDILRAVDIQEEVKEPQRNEELKIFEVFPKFQQEKRRLARIIDSRALVFLRNINRVLHKVNAKLVLVTRDHALKYAAESLSREGFFGWPAVREHIQSIETVFLDLILRDTSSIPTKLAWINETDAKLSEMSDSVTAMLEKMRDKGAGKETSTLAEAGEAVLEHTSKLWDQHLNLQLSLAISATERLHDDYLGISFGTAVDTIESEFALGTSQGRSLRLLRNLWNFVSSEEYRQIARENAKTIWSEIDAECSRMVFLKHLGDEGTERIVKVLSDTLQSPLRPWIALHTRGSLIMPSVHFISPNYEEQLRSLESLGRGDKRRIKKIQTTFYMIVLQATGGDQEPEDFLFMAFILAILELYKDAITMAEHSRQTEGIIDPAEISFFLAFIRRRIAMTATSNTDALQSYVEGYREIVKAREIHEFDPRYMKEEAAIILLYIEMSHLEARANSRIGLPLHEDSLALPVSTDDAKCLLEQALSLTDDDPYRRVEILNNLAYAESLSDNFSFVTAERYLQEIEEIAPEGESSEKILQGFGPHFDDTRIMIDARRAWDEKNKSELERCVGELESVLRKKELTSPERSIFDMHRRVIRNMLQDLS